MIPFEYIILGVVLALLGAYAIILAEPWGVEPRWKWLDKAGKTSALIGLAIIALVLIQHFQQ